MHVYDAHTTIQSTGVMKKIDPATLNKGDVVVAEFNITRHHFPTPGVESDAQQWFKSNWTTWYCQVLRGLPGEGGLGRLANPVRVLVG